MMKSLTMCALGGFVLLAGQLASAQDVERLVITARASREPRLSPELYLVQQTGAELVALTASNEGIYRIPADEMSEVLDNATSINRDVPEEVERVSILISYGDDKPSDDTLAKAGLENIEDYPQGTFVIASPAESLTAASVNTLLDDASVAYIQPDYYVAVPPSEFIRKIDVVPDVNPLQTPNDPLYTQLWGMPNIHAPGAWDCINDAREVIVAVIDTGVDYTHPDLRENMWQSPEGKFGFDFFDNDDDPKDEQNHGTHCAGTIAGVGNNGVGVTGVAWRTRIMAMRFLGPNGSGSSAGAIKCIDWAVDHGAHILSNSWGGGGSSQELKEAIGRAENRGVLFVAAAGNSATDNDSIPHFPSSYSNGCIIAVAAIDESDAITDFSCFGPTSVDIGAPGAAVVSTIRNNQYASYSGTSMATPHVAGAAALAWANSFSSPQQDPSQMTQVRDLLYSHARAVPALVDKWGETAAVKGGVLDIAFLCGEPPVKPQPVCCPVVAAAQFPYGEVTADQNKTIAEASFTLSEAMQVHVTANSSVSANGAPVLFTTGFSDQANAGEMWLESLRYVQVKENGDWVNFGSTVMVTLPAGPHTIRWKVWVDAGELSFDSGAMLIQAFPTGDGASAGAQQAETANARSGDVAVRIDAYGNEVIEQSSASAKDGRNRSVRQR